MLPKMEKVGCHEPILTKMRLPPFLAIVRSQLNHCCVVWRPSNMSKIESLERVKKGR